MDDSEQDFVNLCSKLLKRVRKKAGEPRPPKKAEHQWSSQTSDGEKRRRNKKIGASGSKPLEPLVSEGTGHGSRDAGSSAVPSTGLRSEGDLMAKDKVLHRMQQFKRASPQRMVCLDKRRPTNNYVPFPQRQVQESLDSFTSDPDPEPQDSDEALALRLQQELDREAAVAQNVDVEDGGIFFCQLCHKELSYMSTEGRTQHLNRCLDEREESAQDPPPSVPECPICGKKFKSQKSRLAHLKCCSSEMGISPAALLQALQRQAVDRRNVSTTNTLLQTGNTKRKCSFKPGLPARKKARNRTGLLDEDTMMALALSSSFLEQEKQQQRESKAEIEIQAETTVHPTSLVVKWKPELGKGHARIKKGSIRHPPPLLLVQDAQEALTRLQERVSAVLLRSWPDSLPTPTQCQSGLPGWTSASPLWQKSSLLDYSTGLSDFYTSELRQFITPWEPTKSDRFFCNTSNKPHPSFQPVNERTPDTESRAPILPPSFQTDSCSSAPSTLGTRPVSSQVLLELMEDRMTPTQCSYTALEPNKEVCLSGFVLEEAEEQAVNCVKGFIPETTHIQTHRKSDRSGAEKKCDGHQSIALARLAADLSSMVNNPQLSDVQLQVDSGDVYFAHSFMVYARCPLLAEMVHEVGFGVQEEGSPAAQRVLMSDLPGQAVFALLQYLYTGFCIIPASLQPHVLELASRFDLIELQQLCDLHRDEADYQEDANNQMDQAFMDLLRSMQNEEDKGEEETVTDGANNEQMVFSDQWVDDLTSGDKEISEEKVNEEELDEIYEFAASQRKRREVKDSEGEEEDGGYVVDSNSCSSEKSPKQRSKPESNPSLDRSYNCLFSESWGVYEEGQTSSLSLTSSLSKTPPPVSQQHQPVHKPSSNLSSRALRQSSASVVDEFSMCPSPTASNLPIPGVSTGQVGDCGVGGKKETDGVELDEFPTLKQQSKGPHVCVALSPDSPQNNNKREPELIVLSDSSEEMEVVPCIPKDTKTYTQIKSQQKFNEPNYDKKEFVSIKLSPGDPIDCSPELSWLIPSSPTQRETKTKSSSSQSRNSKCRTQLFPQDEASSPPCVFSSAISDSRLQTSDRVSNIVGLTEDSVSRAKLYKIVPSRSNLDLKCCPKRSSGCDLIKNRDVFTVPRSPCTFTNTPPPQLYSSTPLHVDIQPPGYHAASTDHTGPNEKEDEEKDKATSENEDSPEKTELGSFHLSPLSDPLDQPSLKSFSSISCLSSQRQIKLFREMGRVQVETEEEAKGECGEAGSSECSFQQSFIDEPPIAFNDSWGLDTCADETTCCISLRLEDSRGSSQQDCSLGQGGTTRSLSSISYHPSPSSGCVQSSKSCASMVDSSPSKQLPISIQTHTNRTTPQINSLLDSNLWDNWEEEEEEASPISQRVNTFAHLKTPASSLSKKRRSLVPITPMPHFSDMDTPELKSKLKGFGVRPLPKRQMILKLKEIHQYTHQLVSSDSEDEPPSVGHTAQMKYLTTSPAAAPNRPVSCTQTGKFKEPSVTATISLMKPNRSKKEPLSASQSSNTSSTAASEESERSNPDFYLSSNEDSDSDSVMSASQSANCLQDRLRAVHSFILSDSALYSQILQYQPLVLSQLQERLKANGIRLGASKLVDYLDSQCVTFTTAKPGQSATCRRQGKRTSNRAKTAGKGAERRK